MVCGISTACFYPMETQQSLSLLLDAGVDEVEIFLNSYCEVEPDYYNALVRCVQEHGARVSAVHPFTSGMESFFFASSYEARMRDGLEFYKKYFTVCQKLNAPLLVFHGDFLQTPFSFARHCEHFARLRDAGRSYGVELCQENVARCKCGKPDYIRKMREVLHDDVNFVLDVKQMRRADAAFDDMLDAMRGKIRHLHLSDETSVADCAVPGQGSFDFAALLDALRKQSVAPSAVIELYRGDFTNLEALQAGRTYLCQMQETKELDI